MRMSKPGVFKGCKGLLPTFKYTVLGHRDVDNNKDEVSQFLEPQGRPEWIRSGTKKLNGKKCNQQSKQA